MHAVYVIALALARGGDIEKHAEQICNVHTNGIVLRIIENNISI